jgi:cytochrome c553
MFAAMRQHSPSRPRHSLLLFGAAFLALLLVTAAAGLWHTHSSSQEAAACGVCHVGSTPTPQPATPVLAPPAPAIECAVALPTFAATSAPLIDSKSPRAPPFAS